MGYNHRSLVLWVVVLVLCLSACRTYAGQSAAANDPIDVCYEAWEPYYYPGKDGSTQGVVVDILSEIAVELDRDIVFRLGPFKRCLRAVQTQAAHMVLLVGTPRDNIIMGNIPLAFWAVGAVVRRDFKERDFRTMSQFSGMRVLRIAGYLYPEKIEAARTTWIDLTTHYETLPDGTPDIRPFRMVELNRADVFLEDLAWSEQLIRENGLQLKVLRPAVSIDKNFIGYATGQKALAVQVEAALRARAEDGRMDRLYAQAMNMNWSEMAGNAEAN